MFGKSMFRSSMVCRPAIGRQGMRVIVERACEGCRINDKIVVLLRHGLDTIDSMCSRDLNRRLDQEEHMFGPVTIPFGAKMLFNTVQLKPGVSFDQVELAVGELCMIVKETYGGDKGGFIAGQVFKFSGFVSEEGSLSESRSADDHYAIVTYWHSFEDHEKSHTDEVFNKTFAALTSMCSETKELGYDLLWQGEAKLS
jgi:hypothetical protein